MAFLDAFYFLLRYIPFWSIPIIMIAGQFAYVYWLKDLRRYSYAMMLVVGLSAIFLIYYIWAGSPDRSVYFFNHFLNSI